MHWYVSHSVTNKQHNPTVAVFMLLRWWWCPHDSSFTRDGMDSCCCLQKHQNRKLLGISNGDCGQFYYYIYICICICRYYYIDKCMYIHMFVFSPADPLIGELLKYKRRRKSYWNLWKPSEAPRKMTNIIIITRKGHSMNWLKWGNQKFIHSWTCVL